MKPDHCKGVLAFIDDKYATSYATLLELLYSQFGMNNNGKPQPANKKKILTKRVCSKFVEEIIAMLNINDNPYKRGDSLASMKKNIENTFGKGVFREAAPKQENLIAAVKRERSGPRCQNGCSV